MKLRSARIFFAAVALAVSVLLICGAAMSSPSAGGEDVRAATAKISIDYPLQGSVFPPEITPPEFLWHDPAETATRWVIEVSFPGQAGPMRIQAAGELMQKGKIDPSVGQGIELTSEQASAHTWRPDAQTWEKIKRLSINSRAAITISGFSEGDATTPVSTGKVRISTSVDPVGAPIFYRDVPLIVSPPDEKGPIQPLPQSAIPTIKWEIRNIAEPESRVVMGNLPTCANCHSFSRDGKTMGLDMDGPRNDKGLYALAPIEKNMTITNKNVIRWSSFQVDPGARSSTPSVKRFGFMSQVSPDGRYVVTSIGPPNNGNANQSHEPGFAPGLLDRLYSIEYQDIQFIQVFFPTRGILAWYDKEAKIMRPLPGADDPKYVQTSAFWSPDGKFLIFSRAEAREPFPPGVPKSLHANDPTETQIQYDLYKIPFNEGRGGKAVPVVGASQNGMSNNFPKVSPDGRWIVFVENKNGLLMRPDSRLFMVPFEGGKARLMNCNLSLMNSWHTFSPNGRWLAFSSKARGPYTRLMLTHIDANGIDSPAIIVDDTTAANRAVNIPEFVNVAQGGLEKIDPQVTEFYTLVDKAFTLANSNRVPDAIATLRDALERDPDDAMAHYNLGTLLSGAGRAGEAAGEYRKASELSPEDTLFLEHLGVMLVVTGDAAGGIEKLQKAIELQPGDADFRFNLGFVLESRGDFAAAVAPLEKAVELSQASNARYLAELANAYDKTGRSTEAIHSAQQSLELLEQAHDEQRAKSLRDAIAHYQSEQTRAQPQ
ncbi:MAG: tetratricopeptide repeat protein [Terracidiphilus sp.]|jgi:tetratricopeptide (TPR) repeat protein